jgi:hypothetical protein
MGVRCVDCWKLGYQYEIKREQSTGILASFIPESLPTQLREALSRKSAERMAYGLKSLPSMNEQMGCLERIVVEQQETLWEPQYLRGENESQSDYMNRVIDLAMNERTCSHFSQYIGGLTVADQVDFQRKIELDNKVVYLKRRIMLESLKRLYARLLDLEGLAPQKRGYEFQHLLKDLFQASELNPTENVVVPGEQIDIVLTIQPLTSVLVEAKWQSSSVEAKEVRDFYGKLESRSPRATETYYRNDGASRHGFHFQG